MIVGYARVSAPGQDAAGQVDELKAAGCERIFTEQASAAAGRKRPQLAKALAALAAGDVLTFTRLDRLARSTVDALNTLAVVTEKGAAFRSLRETWADTTTPAGRFLLTVMAGLAELDRANILERTAEGRQRAKARGVKLGRRSVLNAKQRAFIAKMRNAAEPMSIGELQKLLNVSRSTITRATRAYTPGKAPRRATPQIDIEELIAPSPDE